MTVPFWCLLVTILIPYGLAGAGIYFRMRQLGTIDNKNPRTQAQQLTGAGARAVAAQANAWEALPVFGAAVFVSHLSAANAGNAALLSEIFVVARVLHGVAYIANQDVLRTLFFGVGFACCIGLFVISA